jgi:hypothetical protein
VSAGLKTFCEKAGKIHVKRARKSRDDLINRFHLEVQIEDRLDAGNTGGYRMLYRRNEIKGNF